MTQKGEHTWDLILYYHRCPSCGFIMENRQNFQNRLGKLVKELVCERCGHLFLIGKTVKPAFGPLIGSPQPPEFDWL